MFRASSSTNPSTPSRSALSGERRARSPQSSRTDVEETTPPLARRRTGEPLLVASALPSRNELAQSGLLEPVLTANRTPSVQRGAATAAVTRGLQQGSEDEEVVRTPQRGAAAVTRGLQQPRTTQRRGATAVVAQQGTFEDEELPTVQDLNNDFDLLEGGISQTEEYCNFSNVSEQVQNWMVGAQCGISFPKDIINLGLNGQYHAMLRVDSKFNIMGFPYLSTDGINIRRWSDFIDEEGNLNATRIKQMRQWRNNQNHAAGFNWIWAFFVIPAGSLKKDAREDFFADAGDIYRSCDDKEACIFRPMRSHNGTIVQWAYRVRLIAAHAEAFLSLLCAPDTREQIKNRLMPMFMVKNVILQKSENNYRGYVLSSLSNGSGRSAVLKLGVLAQGQN